MIATGDIGEKLKKLSESELISLKEKLKEKGFRINSNNEIVENLEMEEIESVPIQESYNVSNAQKRLWVLDHLEEQSITYNMPSAFIVEGEFNEGAFGKAYEFIISRHESLRTVFISVDGDPRQKVLEKPNSNIEIIDLRDKRNKDKKIEDLAKEDLLKPFNLEKGPLVRFTIIKIEEDKHILLFNMHHIISDGWSMNIFSSEIFKFYNYFRLNRTPDVSPLRIHYKDYSSWQNNLLEGNEILSQKEYWLDKLSGEIPVLDLPSDKVRPVMQSFNGRNLGFILPEEIFVGLKSICKKTQTSLFMVCQALVKILFYRYTGQEDIIFGSPVAGRVHEDLENQIGFYVNTLVFRDIINSEMSFNEVLNSVKTTCTDALNNQNYPFDKLVEDLNVKRDLSRSPLFDVMLVLQNNETSEIETDGLKFSSYITENLVSKFDMTLTFTESDNKLYYGINFNTDIYCDERIQRLSEHFNKLVTSVINNPESKIKELEIIPEKEKNLLLKLFNDTKTDYPASKTIVQLFEEQIRKTPDNIAVVYDNVELTYRELNEKANIVAHFLVDNYEIQPNDLVGVMLERSEKMIISLWGIIKSGAAYVPIDPKYPIERINYIVNDSKPKVIISDRSEDIYLNIDQVLESGRNISDPEGTTAPKNLAYVIYTSGSTGKPKGTLIEHGSLVNRLDWMQRNYPIGSNDTILQKTTYTFDVSVWELFWWSLYGSKVCILNPGGESDPESIVGTIEKYDVTTMHFVPSMYNAFLQYLNSSKSFGKIKSLKQIFSSGEELSVDLVRKSKSIIKENGTKLINLYGPTEATIDVTFFNCDTSSEIIPIGKPISNITMYIVDKDTQLTPLGIPGELCISGVGLARGYLNKPELTSEKFIGNPYLAGERMYRTGDLAHWLPDGNIEYLGRIDNQVKIRGFRIELGEIESELRNHVDIDEIVVIAHENSNKDKSLCAYYISDKELSMSDIKEYLVKKLPQYMIPSFLVRLESIPLTSNGKLDYKNLPEPEYQITDDFIAPESEMEKKVAEILSEILDIENISTNSDLFEIGLNSISCIRFLSKLNEELKLNLSVSTIFLNPTIKGIVEEIKENTMLNDLKHIVKLTKGKKEENIFIIGGDGTVYMFKQLAEYLGKEYNVYGIQAAGIASESKIPKTCNSFLKPYVKEMMEVQKTGSFIIAGYCYGVNMGYRLAHMLESKRRKVKKVIFLDTPPFIGEFTCKHMLLKNLTVHIVNKIIHYFSREEKNRLIKSIEDIERGKYPDYNERMKNDSTYKRMLKVKENIWTLFSNDLMQTKIIDASLLFLVARFSGLTRGKIWMLDHYKKMSKSDDVQLFRIEGGHESLLFDPVIKDTIDIILDNLRNCKE